MARLRSPDWHLRTRLKVRQLALLVAVADHGSVRRAADVTAVTQPAATRMLRELEDALGVSLFDRHAWGMTPTAYGETLLRYARGMLTDLVEAREEIAALAAGAKGRLRVGTETGAVPGLVTPALRDVRQGRPGLRVFVLVNTSDVLVAALRQGTLDVAIGALPAHADAAEFDVEPLRTEGLRAVVRAGHPLTQHARPAPSAMGDLPWILHPPESGMRAEAQAFLARAGVRPPRELVETVSIVATLSLLQSSDAATVLPADLAEHYVAQGLVARLALPAASVGGTVTQMITRSERQLSPAAKEFVAALRRAVATAPSGDNQEEERPAPGDRRRRRR